jgi:hypothetical protein
MSGQSEHPRLYVVLRTRTRLIGTLNLAVALRGKSSGWGGEGPPRRTFVGFHRGSAPPYRRGIELVVDSDPARRGMGTQRTLLRIPLGKSKTTWLFQKDGRP